MAEGKGRVCVTGGTGFIGSWIIKSLLENGYTVNTTVRADPEKKRDLSFLTSLPGASEKLKFFNADLDDPESFNEAIEGCVGIFHTAASVDFEEKEPEEIVTKRSIAGALGILKACKNSKTVKRVVYTSSASAVYCQDKEKEKDVMDESYWSDIDILRNYKPFGWAYSVSKTLAEKAVLEYGQENELDIVTVIPTIVVGPFICPKLPTSVYGVLPYLFGNTDSSPISRFHMVHVDDVARAHIFLLEHPTPKGRYNCSPFLATVEEVVDIVSSKHPEFQIPKSKLLEGPKGLELPHLTSKKLTDAGFEFKHTLEETLEDAIQSCKKRVFFEPSK